MGTLRTTDEVAAALKAAQARDPQKRSVTAIANEILLAGATAFPGPPARTWVAPGTPAQPPKGKRVRRPPEPPEPVGKCVVHPPGRIIDGTCMACGHKV